MAQIDIYSTLFMSGVIREKPKIYTFLKDRYFSQSEEFKTEHVYVDYDDGAGNLMAPFVVPRIGRVPVDRTGYETREITPAYIGVSRPLSIDILTKRLAGESLVSTQTPAQRERAYLVDDLNVLDEMITRREEWMCTQVLLKNACTLKHIGDRNDTARTIDMEVKYYDGSASQNTGVFKPSTAWAVGTASERGTWYNEVCKQIENMYDAGRQVTDLIVGSEVGEMIQRDPWVMQMMNPLIVALMNGQTSQIGSINPQWLENGVIHLGVFNFAGIMLDIFIYRGSYQETGSNGKLTTVSYFPKKGALLAAPNTGIMRYGSITQIEDKTTYTRTGKRVPKSYVDEGSNMRETILSCRPIASPLIKSPWRGCENVFSAT